MNLVAGPARFQDDRRRLSSWLPKKVLPPRRRGLTPRYGLLAAMLERDAQSECAGIVGKLFIPDHGSEIHKRLPAVWQRHDQPG